MAEHKQHLADEIAQAVADEVEAVVETMQAELGYMVGAEEMPTREIRALIRKALDGDDVAFVEVLSLVQQQVESPNPVIREIAAVLPDIEGV